MSGWRGRIGYIAPSLLSNMSQWERMFPDGVAIVSTCLGVQRMTTEVLERTLTLENVVRAAKELAAFDVDIIMVAGAMFVLRGYGSDKEVINGVEAITKIPTTTSATAEIEALKKLSIKKVAMATPFKDELNEKHRVFLEASGFQVLSVKGLQIERNVEVTKLPPYAAYRIAKEAFQEAPEAEGIFIPCGAWIPPISTIEIDLKKPVVACKQAMVWKALDMLSIRESIKGYGQLLEMLWILLDKKGKPFSSEDFPFSHFIELYCQNIRNSPLLLITLQDRERKAPNLSHELIDLMGVGAALQNIRLAAFSLGIACQDLGLPIDTPSGESRLKKLLGIPEKYKIVGIFRLGYRKESPLMATTRFRRELKDIVHRDKF